MKTLEIFRAYWLLKLYNKDYASYFGRLAQFGEQGRSPGRDDVRVEN